MIARLQRLAAVSLFAVAAACSKDPLTTQLPLSLDAIPKIQPDLDRLSAEDRDLVLGYLKRSKGDVLPPNLADPDEPFTARTFGQAIILQRMHLSREVKETARVEAFKAERESGIDPLRAALPIELVNREMVPGDQLAQREPRPGQAVNPDAASRVLVITFRLRNAGNETIETAQGSVTVRSASDPGSLMGLARCYIPRTQPIEGGRTQDVRCAEPRRSPEDSEAFLAMPADQLVLTWEPQSITFAGGRVLKGPN